MFVCYIISSFSQLAALNALWACLRCGGDEYCTVVLPTVVPAVAELMEDLSPVVVRKAHSTVRLLKEISGEERVAGFFTSGGGDHTFLR